MSNDSAHRFSRVLRLPLPSFALVATYAASLVTFFVLSHYNRMPVVPFLVLFAAHAAVRLADALSGRRFALLGIAIACAVPAVAVTRVDLVDETGFRFMTHYNLGNKYREMERFEQAIAEYEKSIALNPDYVSSSYNLALLTERLPARPLLRRTVGASVLGYST